MFYSDCIGGSGWNCPDTRPTEEPAHAEEIIGDVDPITHMRKKYKRNEIFAWKPAESVKGRSGSPGEGGSAVHIPAEDEAKQEELFKLNQFNLMASDMISFNRSLKDVRLEDCKNKAYAKLLPKTSIVIVFHNEAWSTLLRTVWSVINRSPKNLLEEIILVDDASERGEFTFFSIFIAWELFFFFFSLN